LQIGSPPNGKPSAICCDERFIAHRDSARRQVMIFAPVGFRSNDAGFVEADDGVCHIFVDTAPTSRWRNRIA